MATGPVARRNQDVAPTRDARHQLLHGITRIVNHYEDLIRALPEAPILIGHSFGGLFVQLLLDRGLGAAGVAIDPGTPRPVFPGSRAVLSALPVFLAWNGWNRALTMTFEDFAANFANLTLPDEQRAAYDRHVVPTPGRIYYQAVLGIGAGVDWKKPDRAPLLLTAADNDRTVQTSAVEAPYRRYKRGTAVVDFKLFTGRSHWLIGASGWEEVADYVINWAAEQVRQPRLMRRAS